MLEETRRHFLRQKLFSLHIQVSVNVCGHLNIGVTHVFLHIFQRKTVVQQETGTAVPKLVKADMRQMVVLQKKREMGRYIVRGKGRAVGPFEDKLFQVIISVVRNLR